MSVFIPSSVGIRTNYAVTNVGTTNWVVLLDPIPYTVSQLSVTDTSGAALEYGVAVSGSSSNSEQRIAIIPPGGFNSQKFNIPPGNRLSIRAVSAAVSLGENDLNISY